VALLELLNRPQRRLGNAGRGSKYRAKGQRPVRGEGKPIASASGYRLSGRLHSFQAEERAPHTPREAS
jgi:hypothetical protein